MSEQYEKGVALLEDWLMTHPGDPNAKVELENMRGLIGTRTDTLEHP
jgi:hypothetical protein